LGCVYSRTTSPLGVDIVTEIIPVSPSNREGSR